MQVVTAKGVSIPQIGFGTWQLRGAECAKLVEAALRLGYRHLDTAQAYENEAEVGDGLKASGVSRNDVFITTKLVIRISPPKDFVKAAKESMTRLKVSESDLLLVHWPPLPPHTMPEVMDALNAVRDAGLTKNIGVSNFTSSQLDEATKLSKAPVFCDQVEIHPYLDQKTVLAACKRLDIAPVAYCPIARGAILNDPVIAEVAKAHGKSISQVTLRWLLQQGIVIIPRTSKVERAKENFEVFDFTLTPDEMKRLSGLAKPNGRIVSPAWAPVWDAA
jgi:diketogulonate reductase-like aldo/keto reductase